MILVSLSALFAGLTLGIMGFDIHTLEIISKTEPNPILRNYATKILPLRYKGNLLLCTLLLGNVCTNTGFSIITSEITTGLVGFIVSSVFIVIFGEIFPQALCSRYGLFIAGKTLPILNFIIILLYPISYPLSLILDLILGKEYGLIYSNNGLKELLTIHAQSNKSELRNDSLNILHGAMDYGDKYVRNSMKKIEDCFTLNINEIITKDLLHKIWDSGFSRIPIYEEDKRNIVGVLLVKDLILINPDEYISIESAINFFGREVIRVTEFETLQNILQFFKTGKSHIAIVQKVESYNQKNTCVGIITLEDVIENIIKEDIWDETDPKDITKNYENSSSSSSLLNSEDNLLIFDELTNYPNYSNYSTTNFLSNEETRKYYCIDMFENHNEKMSKEEIDIITTYLARISNFFQFLPSNQLRKLILDSSISIIDPEINGTNSTLYSPSEETDTFTLILSGCLELREQREPNTKIFDSINTKNNITTQNNCKCSKKGPWTILFLEAIINPYFTSSVDVTIVKKSLILQIKRNTFKNAILSISSNTKYNVPPQLNWIFNNSTD